MHTQVSSYKYVLTNNRVPSHFPRFHPPSNILSFALLPSCSEKIMSRRDYKRMTRPALSCDCCFLIIASLSRQDVRNTHLFREYSLLKRKKT